MKPNPRAEAERWLAQAQSDLAFAEYGLDGGFYAQACFMCQQAGEKALKALHYPDDIPANVFSRAQASEAVTLARRIVESAAGLLG